MVDVELICLTSVWGFYSIVIHCSSALYVQRTWNVEAIAALFVCGVSIYLCGCHVVIVHSSILNVNSVVLLSLLIFIIVFIFTGIV